MHLTKHVATALVTAGLAVSSAPLLAQTDSGMQQGSQKQGAAAQSADFSQSQIQKFADASSEVRSISTQWKQKIKNAESRKMALKYRQKVSNQMVQAIKDSGLTVKEYTKIAKAARQNPQLAKRIQQAQ